MEKLPSEMLELIFRQLAPQDLARCSAVCRSWYDLINQDWIWMKQCDPQLEEPLRTIPSVATPTFEIPDAKTLTPCHWKLAFLREKHLWKNWRPEKILQFEGENILKFKRKNLLGVDFFSDTQIVAWYSNKIEILDVSVIPAVIVAKTDIPVTIEFRPWLYGKVIAGTNLLFVQKENSIEVFKVDITSKSITLKHKITDSICSLRVKSVKANFYMFVDGALKILDLNTGKLLKAEPWPVNQNERASLAFLHCSPTSDFVYVSVNTEPTNSHRVCKFFVYSLPRLAYLPGPVMTFEPCCQHVTLHNRWMVVLHEKFDELKIFHITPNEEVLFYDKISLSTYIYPPVHVCNGWFVFADTGGVDSDSDVDYDSDTRHHCLRAYSPSSKTLITLDENFKHNFFKVINNRVVAVFEDGKVSKAVWKPSSRGVERCDFTVVDGCKINQSFTIVVNQGCWQRFRKLERESWLANHYWYTKHLW